jgi:hypothetical protein
LVDEPVGDDGLPRADQDGSNVSVSSLASAIPGIDGLRNAQRDRRKPGENKEPLLTVRKARRFWCCEGFGFTMRLRRLNFAVAIDSAMENWKSVRMIVKWESPGDGRVSPD